MIHFSNANNDSRVSSHKQTLKVKLTILYKREESNSSTKITRTIIERELLLG